VGAHRKRRSPKRYTRYMDLMTKLVETGPSYFEKVVEKLFWVDAMVEEYESIMKNNALEFVPRPIDKSVMGLRWIFKVKNVVYRRIEKYKAIFVSKGFSQVEGSD